MTAREPLRERVFDWFRDYPFTTWTIIFFLALPLILGGFFSWYIAFGFALVYGLVAAIWFICWIIRGIFEEHF